MLPLSFMGLHVEIGTQIRVTLFRISIKNGTGYPVLLNFGNYVR